MLGRYIEGLCSRVLKGFTNKKLEASYASPFWRMLVAMTQFRLDSRGGNGVKRATGVWPASIRRPVRTTSPLSLHIFVLFSRESSSHKAKVSYRSTLQLKDDG